MSVEVPTYTASAIAWSGCTPISPSTSQMISAQAALRYYDLLVEQISSLSHMPFRCPRPRDAALAAKGYRYLLVEKYLVFYVVVGDTVQIRRILYARRNYQSVLADPMS